MMRSEAALELEGELRRQRAASDAEFDLARERENCDHAYRTTPEASGVRTERETVVGVPCLRIRPDVETARFETVYLHGGGFCLLSALLYSRMAGHFANIIQGQVLLPDYSLAPEHPFPAALDECSAVVRSRLSSAGMPVALAGDSAGGNLVMSVMARLRDDRAPLPFASVLFAPWLDLTMSGESNSSAVDDDLVLTPEALTRMAEYYLQGRPADAPDVSPLFTDLSSLPPMLVQAAGLDLLRDDSLRLLASGLKEPDLQVKTFPGMLHAFQQYAGRLPEADAALREAAEFFLSRLPR